MDNIQIHNFTTEYRNKVNVLVTDVIIGHPDSHINKSKPHGRYQAIWDTGATGSVITKKVVDDLKLFPVSQTNVQGVTGSSIANVYLVSITLPNNVTIFPIKVTECEKLSGDFAVLIGMDIIGNGDFAVTNANNHTVMSFRFPSISRIDFTSPEKTMIHPNEGTSGLSREERRAVERIRKKGPHKRF
jgi:predicted aspartyl protease